jgi:putative aminopeptidase FrvX
MCLIWAGLLASGQTVRIEYGVVPAGTLESRLKLASHKLDERRSRLMEMFSEAGCGAGTVIQQKVPRTKEPNLICTVPGDNARKIVIGAHYDSAGGDGVIDNWSGAILLPSLFQMMKAKKLRHTVEVVGFAAEEVGLLGSKEYLKSHRGSEREAIAAVIAIDSIGLGPVRAWPNSSDRSLLNAASALASAMRIDFRGVNVDAIGTSDSMVFKNAKVPVLSLHSVTQDNFRIINSPADKLAAVSWKDYYETYKFVSALVMYLDAGMPIPGQ